MACEVALESSSAFSASLGLRVGLEDDTRRKDNLEEIDAVTDGVALGDASIVVAHRGGRASFVFFILGNPSFLPPPRRRGARTWLVWSIGRCRCSKFVASPGEAVDIYYGAESRAAEYRILCPSPSWVFHTENLHTKNINGFFFGLGHARSPAQRAGTALTANET
jgi:hypothetical protein